MTKIATIIPIYSALETFERSLSSVLKQELPNGVVNHVFCVLSGMTCDYAEQYEKIINKNTNVTLLQQPIKGIVPALNKGLFKAIEYEADLIARQDADDEWLPGKLIRQIKFLNDYPEVGVLGTGLALCNKHGEIIDTQHNPLDSDICLSWIANGRNPIAHPSVVFRTQLLYYVGGYEQLFLMAEDLHLWQKFSRITQLANLQEIFLKYTAVHNSAYNPKYPILATQVFNFLKEQKI